MFFSYTPIRHGMRKMHAFVSFIFARVWCKAPGCEYSIDLFRGMPDLYVIMEELDREDKAGKDKGAGAYFYQKVNEIFIEFKSLSPSDVKYWRQMFLANNNIQALCEGRLAPLRYARQGSNLLNDRLKEFFGNLYGSGFFSLKIVKDNIGVDLRDHYHEFAKRNSMPCCPFCGLIPMDTEHDPTKEAYDHYLPSSVYPFNSVNLRNLAPSCYKCNSQNKGAQDPLWSGGHRRRAFYPYSLSNHSITVSVRFVCNGQRPTEPSHVDIDLACPGFEQEVATWDSLFKIRSRFAAKCCSQGTSSAWLNRVMIECRNYGRSPCEALEAELAGCELSPLVDAGFLKAAFLREADRTGVVSDAVK